MKKKEQVKAQPQTLEMIRYIMYQRGGGKCMNTLSIILQQDVKKCSQINFLG